MATTEADSKDLLTMLYRSRATVPFGATELFDLVKGARRRNRLRSVTGALFFEDGQFYQWIEGPEQAVSPLFTTIGRDPRHSDIEVLSVGPTDTRVFADWNLRLYRNRRLMPESPYIAEPRKPCGAPACISHDMALELVRGNTERFREALDEVSGRVEIQVCYCEQLMARIRDLWADDECLEAEVSIGYALALSAFRQAVGPIAETFPSASSERVIVALLPGEPHYLRAALATAMLDSAGYLVSHELPASADELVASLSMAQPASLVLVAGAACLTCHQQRALEDICDRARVECGSGLRIAVYGQLEDQCKGLHGLAQADHLTASALRLPDVFDLGCRRVH